MSTIECNIVGDASGDSQQQLNNFWPRAVEDIKRLKANDFKTQELPLARIKKIMKLDEDVKMISAEAPAVFAKAAELFISELTLRAWVHAEENKRRTLQRNDIAMAISKYDQFDFLIDIVPREEIRPMKKEDNVVRTVVGTGDQVQYYFQMSQPQQQTTVQQGTTQIQLQAPLLQQPIQILTGGSPSQVSTLVAQSQAGVSQPQIIQLQAAGINSSPMGGDTQSSASQPQSMQVYTQVVTPSGEVQHIPIQLTPAQIQAITLQMQGKQPNQPIVIQTPLDQSNEGPLFQIPMFATGSQSDNDQGTEQSD